MEVLCWIDREWSSKECACCVCDPSVHLGVPSIGFVYAFECRKLSHLRVLRAGSQVFALMCFFVLFCILRGRVRACSCYASCPLVCCDVCHQYDVCKNYVGSVYVGGYGGLSESGLLCLP